MNALERLAESGLIRRWVAEQRGTWDHDSWLRFLDRVTAEFGPLPTDRVGLYLEVEKRHYWGQKAHAGEAGPCHQCRHLNQETDDLQSFGLAVCKWEWGRTGRYQSYAFGHCRLRYEDSGEYEKRLPTGPNIPS